MQRNINLAYLLIIAKNSWFWLGIWVLYYLKFTDYKGIGLIEMLLFLTITFGEIPTGAIADLFGKKRTLFISFSIYSIGGLLYAFSNQFSHLFVSVFILAIGACLFSGTLEALVYDTLKQEGQESRFERVIANISSLQFLVPAICSVIGGFAYAINFRLPFILNALFYIFGMIVTLFLVEPKIDTEKFSLINFINQTKKGFAQLTQTAMIKRQIIIMLLTSSIVVLFYEMLDSIISVEYGLNAQAIGILWGITYLVSSFISQFTYRILKILKISSSFFATGIVYGLTLVLSPFANMFAGSGLIVARSGLQGLYENFSKIYINSFTESKYRATTISTFNMMKNVPYALSAVYIGSLADIYSAKTIAGFLGISMIVLILIEIVTKPREVSN